MEAVAEPSARRLPVTGETFGRYRIVRMLGEGGMGIVFEALHVDLNKPVAIKILRPELAQSEPAQLRFLREGEAAARIRHPHIVDVIDVGNHAGLPFLVMELLEGEDLETALQRQGRLEVSACLDLLLPVISGVAAGHAQGVIHRDLKPQNIFLARQGTGEIAPKVLDFGVSKLLESQRIPVKLTAAGAIYGTVQYMAPEQASGAENADPRSDQYTLAAILCECLTGQRVFPGDNTLELLRRISAGEFAAPRTLREDLSPEIEAVVLRAMSLAVRDRFESLRAFGRALLPFASDRARLVWGAHFAEVATAAAAAPEAAPVAEADRSAAPTSSPAATTLVAPRSSPAPLSGAPAPSRSGSGSGGTRRLPTTDGDDGDTDGDQGGEHGRENDGAAALLPKTLALPSQSSEPSGAAASTTAHIPRGGRRPLALPIAAAGLGATGAVLALVVALSGRAPPPPAPAPEPEPIRTPAPDETLAPVPAPRPTPTAAVEVAPPRPAPPPEGAPHETPAYTAASIPGDGARPKGPRRERRGDGTHPGRKRIPKSIKRTRNHAPVLL